jgi:hypothetical protein
MAIGPPGAVVAVYQAWQAKQIALREPPHARRRNAHLVRLQQREGFSWR